MNTYAPAEEVSGELCAECHNKYVQLVPVITFRQYGVVVSMWLYGNNISMILGLTSETISYRIILTHMEKNQPSEADTKKKALRESGALHPKPEAIHDELFLQDEFFDPHDSIQVKYEMLRRHREEGKSVTEIARAFGTSRQAFYTTKEIFERRGIPGLIPKRRGPRTAHKCTEEVLRFAHQWQEAHPDETTYRLVEVIQHHFGIHIHPRTVSRALARWKKKRPPEMELPK